jgi:heparan-alpha-glucosaminide N-acetyltransferase
MDMIKPFDERESDRIVTKQDALPGVGGRIASVDALRGLTILLMIFVNDLGHGAPSWMHHIQPPNADGMTLADVVFPAFLFIVGVSIPLAFERARAAGKSGVQQLGHILIRTAALLFMGVIVLNTEEHPATVGPIWGVLAFIALVLAWTTLPQEPKPGRNILLVAKLLGLAGLIVLLALYRTPPGSADLPFYGRIDNWMWLRTGWWGILGLIGWAYLTVGVLVLVLGWRREWLMGALAILIILHLAFQHGGLFTHVQSKSWLGPLAGFLTAMAHIVDRLGEYVSLSDATGSLAAITMAGCLLGTILRPGSEVIRPRARVVWALTFALGLFVAGCVTDTFEGINKIAATPTWCLWSAAITSVVWILLYLLLDVAGFKSWSILIRPAGANPLVAYFLHPILVEGIAVAGLEGTLLAYNHAADPWVIVAGSVGMAALVCAATGVLGQLGLKVRL